MIIYTIGFTKKSASQFFGALRRSGAKHLLDIRLNNTSQLAGFTKKSDLQYFLKQLVNMEYHEVSILAPDKSILEDYRKNKDWTTYERKYKSLIRQRQVEKHIPLDLLYEGAVLLCSEAEATKCHRRLAAEYLAQTIPEKPTITHI